MSENVYLNPSTSALAIVPQPLRNLANSKRYRILASKYIRPGGAMISNDNAGTAAFTSTINCQVGQTVSLSWRGNIVCDSKGTTADIASAADNAIHLLAYRAGNPQGTFTGKSRVRFVG